MSLDELEAVLRQRRVSAPAGSYSATLVNAPDRASRKLMEEAYELCFELTRPTVDRRRVTEEAADLVFHMLAGLVAVDVPVDDVLAELTARRGSNNQDEMSSEAGGRLP
jgi:phosphoribosyl-ATP pyrophosphohydrolase